MFSDTDSLCYHIMEADILSQLSQIAAFMDFSNYDSLHPLYSTQNAFIPGRLAKSEYFNKSSELND